MKKNNFTYCLLFAVIASVLFSCKKQFLDPKTDDSLVVPTTLKDLQALLDNDEYMNGGKSLGPHPPLLFAGTDEYYIADSRYTASPFQYVRNAYIWKVNNLYEGLSAVNDWASPYRTIYYANVVLAGLDKMGTGSSNNVDFNNAKGSALFYRAFAFYQLAQVYAQPYNPTTAGTDLGIPLRLSPDINEPSVRASVAQTYQQIETDLNAALILLPDKSLFNTRPSKAAVYALLARMTLGQEKYDAALDNADKCIQAHPALIDFNTLTASAAYPMPVALQNPEIIFFGCVINQQLGSNLVGSSAAIIDSTLYSLYKVDDLRKSVFFKDGTIAGTKMFKGSLTKGSLAFAGFATDEAILIKAECLARRNEVTAAMDALNLLLKSRWKNGQFTPLSANSADNALSIILAERRKSLLLRGTRWTDLKRLNKDARFAVTLYRNVLGQKYSLPPGDKRYTWPIPDDVLSFNPGMVQNPY